MNKTKWIVGISIASIMALSGTVFAMNSGSYIKPVGQNAISAYSVNKTPNLGTGTETKGSSAVNNNSPVTSQSTSTSPSSMDSRPNNVITPGSNEFTGRYGMGGYGTNGSNGGYGMMGGSAANGNGRGYGMMGGSGVNGTGVGYGMMSGYSINSNGNK